jgi:hypothetical protein
MDRLVTTSLSAPFSPLLAALADRAGMILSPKAAEFIESVLRLQPKVAVFDCDGTLWAGDAGEGFFYWELERGVVSDEIARRARARYTDYKAGKVDEETMCGEMVTLHRGLPEAEVQKAES